MELKINNKLVAYTGCIGRREYILNILYLGLINTFLVIPFILWQITQAGTVADMYNTKELLASAPVFALFFYVLAVIISYIIGPGLMIRRLSDMIGARKPQMYALVVLAYIAPYIWLFFRNPITALLYFFVMIFCIVLMCVPGKITGQLPPDSVKRFNWGAFWGTWIWGLFNKSYITLWAIPLLFTPAFYLFALICGIKGNEWAYKKKNTVDVADFHKGQRHQAIGWNIFAGFAIFILPILLIFLITAVMVTAAIKDPENFNNFANKTEALIESYYDSQFEEYTIDIDENRFYMDPENWVGLGFNERYNLLKAAATLAYSKKKQSTDKKFEKYQGSTYKEMEITRIYSAYNGEILAEFKMNTTQVNDFKSALKTFMQSVKFNPNPTLPPKD